MFEMHPGALEQGVVRRDVNPSTIFHDTFTDIMMPFSGTGHQVDRLS